MTQRKRAADTLAAQRLPGAQAHVDKKMTLTSDGSVTRKRQGESQKSFITRVWANSKYSGPFEAALAKNGRCIKIKHTDGKRCKMPVSKHALPEGLCRYHMSATHKTVVANCTMTDQGRIHYDPDAAKRRKANPLITQRKVARREMIKALRQLRLLHDSMSRSTVANVTGTATRDMYKVACDMAVPYRRRFDTVYDDFIPAAYEYLERLIIEHATDYLNGKITINMFRVFAESMATGDHSMPVRLRARTHDDRAMYCSDTRSRQEQYDQLRDSGVSQVRMMRVIDKLSPAQKASQKATLALRERDQREKQGTPTPLTAGDFDTC